MFLSDIKLHVEKKIFIGNSFIISELDFDLTGILFSNLLKVLWTVYRKRNNDDNLIPSKPIKYLFIWFVDLLRLK